jgi:hypothetical protein
MLPLSGWLCHSSKLTGDAFYKKIEVDFNQYSKIHYRNAKQIKTWYVLVSPS